jgi:hypothetical protein
VRARLLHDRALALNLHGLLAPGGICVRVEYAACRREKLGRGDLLAVAFAEGSLDPRLVDGGKVRQLFRVVAARHVRSRVIEDVRQQAGGVREPSGGYTITVLRRI